MRGRSRPIHSGRLLVEATEPSSPARPVTSWGDDVEAWVAGVEHVEEGANDVGVAGGVHVGEGECTAEESDELSLVRRAGGDERFDDWSPSAL